MTSERDVMWDETFEPTVDDIVAEEKRSQYDIEMEQMYKEINQGA